MLQILDCMLQLPRILLRDHYSGTSSINGRRFPDDSCLSLTASGEISFLAYKIFENKILLEDLPADQDSSGKSEIRLCLGMLSQQHLGFGNCLSALRISLWAAFMAYKAGAAAISKLAFFRLSSASK